MSFVLHGLAHMLLYLISKENVELSSSSAAMCQSTALIPYYSHQQIRCHNRAESQNTILVEEAIERESLVRIRQRLLEISRCIPETQRVQSETSRASIRCAHAATRAIRADPKQSAQLTRRMLRTAEERGRVVFYDGCSEKTKSFVLSSSKRHLAVAKALGQQCTHGASHFRNTHIDENVMATYTGFIDAVVEANPCLTTGEMSQLFAKIYPDFKVVLSAKVAESILAITKNMRRGAVQAYGFGDGQSLTIHQYFVRKDRSNPNRKRAESETRMIV